MTHHTTVLTHPLELPPTVPQQSVRRRDNKATVLPVGPAQHNEPFTASPQAQTMPKKDWAASESERIYSANAHTNLRRCTSLKGQRVLVTAAGETGRDKGTQHQLQCGSLGMDLGMVHLKWIWGCTSQMDLGMAHSNALRLWYPVKLPGPRVPKAKCCRSLLPEEVSSASSDTLTTTSSVLTTLVGGRGGATTPADTTTTAFTAASS